MTRRIIYKPCEECGENVRPHDTLPGMAVCTKCGLMQVAEATEFETQAHEVAPADEFKIPDYVEVFYGFRAWNIDRSSLYGDEPRLYSVTNSSFYWPPREEVEAVCPHHRGRNAKPGPPPHVGHNGCGLYAAKNREHLQTMGYHLYGDTGPMTVIGKVKLWGNMREGTAGWRAQYGYPDTIYVPYEAWEAAEPIGELYGVTIQIDNTLEGSS